MPWPAARHAPASVLPYARARCGVPARFNETRTRRAHRILTVSMPSRARRSNVSYIPLSVTALLEANSILLSPMTAADRREARCGGLRLVEGAECGWRDIAHAQWVGGRRPTQRKHLGRGQVPPKPARGTQEARRARDEPPLMSRDAGPWGVIHQSRSLRQCARSTPFLCDRAWSTALFTSGKARIHQKRNRVACRATRLSGSGDQRCRCAQSTTAWRRKRSECLRTIDDARAV